MPGESFGAGGAGHLRVALTVGVDEITEACKRMREAGGAGISRRNLRKCHSARIVLETTSKLTFG